MKKLKYFLGLVGCLILSGCALFPAKVPKSPDATALIAQDVVSVLVQIAELPAATTTLNIPSLFSVQDPFALTLAEKLRGAGYAVRTAEGSHPGEAIVSYELARYMDPQNGAVSRYTVSVGAISVRRAYVTIDDQHVRPLAPMQIKGASAVGLRLDNQLFENQGLSRKPQGNVVAETGGVSEGSSKPLTQPESTTETLLLPSENGQRSVAESAPQKPSPNLEQTADPSLLDIVAPATQSVAGQGSDLSALRGLADSPTRNVRELGQSNFAEVFARLIIVKEVILTFDNDSVRMGPVNKTRVNDIVGLFDESTDVFSVIGCSNGATNLAIGQEGLALGRAERVREELLFAGVPSENILEEGCWAGDYYDERMPRRGVVLSLKRRPG